MKKLTTLLLFSAVCSFAQTAVEKTKFTATITNRTIDTLVLEGPQKFVKKIAVNKKGKFQEELTVNKGFYKLSYGKKAANVYFMPGKDLEMNVDAKNFNESLTYKGKAAPENNYLAQALTRTTKFNSDIYTKDQAAFDKAVADRKESERASLAKENLDPEFKENMSKGFEMSIAMTKKKYSDNQKIKDQIGKAAVNFDFENHKGGKTKLSDLKGKYVYIDIWATWCQPCRKEIPFLQKLEEKYHGKNIEFVSISVDTEKDYEKWKKLVSDKQMGGTQLIADKNWNSEFIKAYEITGIPRFMLIDPQGNFISNDAERPSNPKLEAQLDELLK